MLYLDIMTQDGGQMYLDIHAVEKISRAGATGISLQGVLGDGYQEALTLVEYVAGEITLTCIDCSAAAFAIAEDGCTDDLCGQLRRALKEELAHAGDWLAAGGQRSREGSALRSDIV